MKVNEDEGMAPLRCPHCGGELVCVGSRDVAIAEADVDVGTPIGVWLDAEDRSRTGRSSSSHAPGCGSHDTVAVPRAHGVEELECDSCGTITSLQMVPSVL